ncbi:hypothetical protein BH09MYX1_BH09MYX1_51630 [soil metagenome]
MTFAEHAIYTILAETTLDELAKRSGDIDLRETKRWVTGKRLFDAAKRVGNEMAVIYADAAYDCSKLVYWGRLTHLEVSATGTSYTVTDLRPIRRHRAQELVLESTGQTIAEGYLRPYAIVETPSFVAPATPLTNKPTTLFTFGYWGCGSATKELVAGIDAAERLRGFEPPLWVDIRIQRSVRAAGFRDHASADLLGPRYVWMRALGNKRVADGESGIEIKEPAAANDLLDLARSNPRRRVIYFCSCEWPTGCHRRDVAQLVVRAAKARDLRTTVVEWPGGEPGRMTIEVTTSALKKLRQGAKTLPSPAGLSLGAACSVAWGTTATVHAGTDGSMFRIGPARFAKSGAYLPVIDGPVDDESRERAARESWRRAHALVSSKSSTRRAAANQ